MERYWDQTEEERAALTTEEVEDLLKVELMERGVLRPKPPVMEPVEEVNVTKATVFVVKHKAYGQSLGIAFETADAAHAFLALCPLYIESDYSTKTSYTNSLEAPSVASEQIAREGDVQELREQLKEVAARKDRNEKRQRDYEKAIETVSKETALVWADWYACKERAAHLQRVRETLDEYTRMTGGNAEIARSFLAKVFEADDIAAALGETSDFPKPTPKPAPRDEVAF